MEITEKEYLRLRAAALPTSAPALAATATAALIPNGERCDCRGTMTVAAAVVAADGNDLSVTAAIGSNGNDNISNNAVRGGRDSCPFSPAPPPLAGLTKAANTTPNTMMVQRHHPHHFHRHRPPHCPCHFPPHRPCHCRLPPPSSPSPPPPMPPPLPLPLPQPPPLPPPLPLPLPPPYLLPLPLPTPVPSHRHCHRHQQCH
jgi:hypothetical protein